MTSVERAARMPCAKCGAMAVWYYVPSSTGGNRGYCDSCVSRGCSCNLVIDESGVETEEQVRDDTGRLLPCCEYDYDADGFDV